MLAMSYRCEGQIKLILFLPPTHQNHYSCFQLAAEALHFLHLSNSIILAFFSGPPSFEPRLKVMIIPLYPLSNGSRDVCLAFRGSHDSAICLRKNAK